LTKRLLLHSARVHSQADGQVFDSIVLNRNRIIAVGNNLQSDPDFKSYAKIDLAGRTVVPGFVDAHVHFYYFALSLGRVNLDGAKSLDECLKRIGEFSKKRSSGEWIVGEGYAPARFEKRVEPTRHDLDKVTGGRPSFIFSKDQHSAWINTKALELGGIDARTPQPSGGRIEHLPDGSPSGIVREKSGYEPVFEKIVPPSRREIDKLYKQALEFAYRNGVTGVHSVDGPPAFAYFAELAERQKVGLRINYYPSASLLDKLEKEKIYFGMGTDFFRIAGIKIFSDGSLGSQTAYCFNKYKGTGNCGIEIVTPKEITKLAKRAAKLGLPCAIHAIGDHAVANVLDGLQDAPRLSFGARHRIEHLQLVRRKDLPRLKKMNIVASMQPSHCTSDIEMVRKYWGAQGRNAYIFRTVLDSGIDLAFGSDCPIEPLLPLEGIAAAVRRARPGSRDVFYKEERISAAEAIFAYTVGPARAVGQEHLRGYLLPGYPADLAILSDDPTRLPASKLYDISVLGTMLDGRFVYRHDDLKL